MVSIPPTFYTNVCPECDAQILPPLMTPQLRQTEFWTALQKYTHQKVNAHLLSSYGDGIGFHIWTSKPPVNNSLKGMRLRTTPNYTPLFTTLGVSLVQTAPGEVLTALERGVVDGYGWPAIGMFDLGWGAHTKYRIDPGFYNVIVNVLVNLDKWNALREDQRTFLNRMASWLEAENVRWVAERKAADDKKIKEAGIQVVDVGANHRKLAYDAYCDALAKRAPDYAGKGRRRLVIQKSARVQEMTSLLVKQRRPADALPFVNHQGNSLRGRNIREGIAIH